MTVFLRRVVRSAPLITLLLLSPAQASPATAQPMPAGFVDAATVADGLVVDMRYFGEDNFVGARIDGYEGARCLLSRQAATGLARVQQDLTSQGFGLKVFEVDERYSTTEALAGGAADADAASACIILEQFLRSLP